MTESSPVLFYVCPECGTTSQWPIGTVTPRCPSCFCTTCGTRLTPRLDGVKVCRYCSGEQTRPDHPDADLTRRAEVPEVPRPPTWAELDASMRTAKEIDAQRIAKALAERNQPIMTAGPSGRASVVEQILRDQVTRKRRESMGETEWPGTGPPPRSMRELASLKGNGPKQGGTDVRAETYYEKQREAILRETLYGVKAITPQGIAGLRIGPTDARTREQIRALTVPSPTPPPPSWWEKALDVPGRLWVGFGEWWRWSYTAPLLAVFLLCGVVLGGILSLWGWQNWPRVLGTFIGSFFFGLVYASILLLRKRRQK